MLYFPHEKGITKHKGAMKPSPCKWPKCSLITFPAVTLPNGTFSGASLAWPNCFVGVQVHLLLPPPAPAVRYCSKRPSHRPPIGNDGGWPGSCWAWDSSGHPRDTSVSTGTMVDGIERGVWTKTKELWWNEVKFVRTTSCPTSHSTRINPPQWCRKTQTRGTKKTTLHDSTLHWNPMIVYPYIISHSIEIGAWRIVRDIPWLSPVAPPLGCRFL